MSDLNALAAALLDARMCKTACEAELKTANRMVEEAEEALFAAMVDAELPKITANGYGFSLDTKAYYSVRPDALDDFAEVMEGLGLADIFKRTVHYQTLNATLRELAAQHEGELPEEVRPHVSVFDRGKVTVRKAK